MCCPAGAIIAGVGTGWMREEFAALGTPPFAERGAVTDEYLHAWRTLWTEPRPALAGKYARFDNVVFAPKPASRPHPPIWVGGESPPALRRTVTFGDAWYPMSNNQKSGSIRRHACAPASPRCTASRSRQAAIRLRSTSPSLVRPARMDRRQGPDGRRLFSGSASDMLQDVAALEQAGARHVSSPATPDD